MQKVITLTSYKRFKGINGQINEQRNTQLKKLKNQVSNMAKDRFMKQLTLLLYPQNVKKWLGRNLEEENVIV